MFEGASVFLSVDLYLVSYPENVTVYSINMLYLSFII